MLIEKDKIPKSSSFVLKSTALQQSMQAAGITVSTSLRHVSSGIFFDAYFWPPRPGVPYERFYVRAGCVPSSEAQAARQFVESDVLPSFVRWAKEILALPPDSPVRRSEQVLAFAFPGHAPNNSFKPKPLRGSA